jgi:hypothetical protein
MSPQRRSGAKFLCVLVLFLTASATPAQSLDPNTPAPIRTNSVTGRIAARDLGDSRVTDHYFAFTGIPGDLLITVQSQNLNGDVDVFTAGTLRPLLKLTLYAELDSPVTKSLYLRKREDLILRVEARSPSDEEGTYRLFFGGSFEPIVGGPDIAEAEPDPSPEIRTPGTRRVTSVGARIEEPAPPPVTEVAAAPTPEPEPEPTPEAKPVETPAPVPEKSPEVEAERPAPTRTTRPRRPAGRRPTPRPTPRDTTTTTTEEPKPKPEPEPEPEIGPRLLIETNDGTLINRPMSTVRRVTIENGQVVVVGRDGKIDRILLANVVRMSISP